MFARDLKRLRNAAQRIADGDLSPPDEHPAPNLELAQLQDAFVTMAARLRDTRDALDRQFEQERKMRETLQSLQRQVVRQERLAAVGLLVSGVAHELNNPLQAILGTLELLERDDAISPAMLEEIAFVKTQSGRAREIIRNLSRFSSQQSGPPTLVDLRDVIGEIVQLRKKRPRQRVDRPRHRGVVGAQGVRELHRARAGDAELRHQRAAGHRGSERSQGRILIRLTDTGKNVRLEVGDNGPGVRPSDEPKLFQPFFTTKPVGKGTGLGLSVSYGIIESYGGAIGYFNNEWGGATFFFELPAADLRRRTPGPRMTERLYYADPYCREFDATIRRVERRDGRTLVTLDRTAFYPTSGGQPFDTGTLGPLRVVDVIDEDDGTVAHVLDELGLGPANLLPGRPSRPRDDRLAQAFRSHAAAQRPARPVGRLRSAVCRQNGQLPSRQRPPPRLTSLASCPARRSPSPRPRPTAWSGRIVR